MASEKKGVGQHEKGERFHALHQRAGAFVIPNPWDAGTARLLAGLGFEALATTSAGFAYTLGRRDGAVSREETLANAAAIVAASDLPVSADLENGYGDAPEAAAETIRAAGKVGLVGGSIEDATGNPRKPIYELAHATERVAAAAEASRRLGFRFTLTARAENFLRGEPDLDDTIRRLQAYEKAGADVLYAPGLRDLDSVRTVCAALTRPVNFIAGGKGQKFSVADLAEVGVQRISVGSSFARAALGAFLRAANEVRSQGTFTFGNDATPYDELNRLMAE